MRTLAILLTLTAFSGPAFALDKEEAKTVASGLEALGFKQQNNNNGPCKIIIDADQDKIIGNIPLLLKMDVLNQDLSKNELAKAPTKTTLAVAMQVAPIEIKVLYDSDNSLDRCFFLHNLVSQDDYGNSKKEVMFSYKFDRALYNKINWDKFQSTNLIKVAKDFYANPDVFRRINDE